MSKNTTDRARAINTSRVKEMISLCRENGVKKLAIDGLELEFSDWAIAPKMREMSFDEISQIAQEGNLGHNDEKTDLDLLLHSAI